MEAKSKNTGPKLFKEEPRPKKLKTESSGMRRSESIYLPMPKMLVFSLKSWTRT